MKSLTNAHVADLDWRHAAKAFTRDFMRKNEITPVQLSDMCGKSPKWASTALSRKRRLGFGTLDALSEVIVFPVWIWDAAIDEQDELWQRVGDAQRKPREPVADIATLRAKNPWAVKS